MMGGKKERILIMTQCRRHRTRSPSGHSLAVVTITEAIIPLQVTCTCLRDAKAVRLALLNATPALRQVFSMPRKSTQEEAEACHVVRNSVHRA